MKTFYFNTGVRPETVNNPSFPYEYHEKIGNVIRGTLLIPFKCNKVPKGATFAFACDNPDLNPGQYIVREIIDSPGMASKYAYFKK